MEGQLLLLVIHGSAFGSGLYLFFLRPEICTDLQDKPFSFCKARYLLAAVTFSSVISSISVLIQILTLLHLTSIMNSSEDFRVLYLIGTGSSFVCFHLYLLQETRERNGQRASANSAT